MNKISQGIKASRLLKITLVLVPVLCLLLYHVSNRNRLESEPRVAGAQTDGGQIERYGVVRRFSTSGTMAFNYFDIERQAVIDGGQADWFWGGIEGDEQRIADFVKYIYEHDNVVFRLTGDRQADDCTYYSDRCLESIRVEKIEAVQSLLQ